MCLRKLPCVPPKFNDMQKIRLKCFLGLSSGTMNLKVLKIKKNYSSTPLFTIILYSFYIAVMLQFMDVLGVHACAPMYRHALYKSN